LEVLGNPKKKGRIVIQKMIFFNFSIRIYTTLLKGQDKGINDIETKNIRHTKIKRNKGIYKK